jgi:hypothetical protein
MGKKDISFLLLLLAVLIAGFVVVVGYPPRARFFPMIVISLCGVIVMGELLKAFIAHLKSGAAGRESRGKEESPETGKPQQKTIELLAWISGFALSIWLLGFVIGMPLFMLVYVKMKGEGWRWAIILSVTMFLIVYACFSILLNIPVYEGMLFLQ